MTFIIMKTGEYIFYKAGTPDIVWDTPAAFLVQEKRMHRYSWHIANFEETFRPALEEVHRIEKIMLHA